MSLPVRENPSFENSLLEIVRTLPPGRAEQLLDFARFLEAQTLAEDFNRESSRDVEEENKRWDNLLASPEAQSMLNRLADQALSEHRAGKTTPRLPGKGLAKE